MNPQTDAEIVKTVLEGDKNAYGLLVDAFSGRIINYLTRMTGSRCEAEDLAQETFVRAYCALHTFNSDYKFSTWLFKIATNLCINHLKKRRRLIWVDDYQGEDGETAWVFPDTNTENLPTLAVQRRELQQQIQEAINQLPDAYRSVVVLRQIHGLSYQEIAEVTEVPIGTVKSRLGRGRSHLVKVLENKV